MAAGFYMLTRFLSIYILTDFNNATLTSLYIFQKTVECKHLLLR